MFQSTLSNREQAVDAHTLALVTKLSNPAFLKDNNSCGGHEQTLIKDGEKDVTVSQRKGFSSEVCPFRSARFFTTNCLEFACKRINLFHIFKLSRTPQS